MNRFSYDFLLSKRELFVTSPVEFSKIFPCLVLRPSILAQAHCRQRNHHSLQMNYLHQLFLVHREWRTNKNYFFSESAAVVSFHGKSDTKGKIMRTRGRWVWGEGERRGCLKQKHEMCLTMCVYMWDSVWPDCVINCHLGDFLKPGLHLFGQKGRPLKRGQNIHSYCKMCLGNFLATF